MNVHLKKALDKVKDLSEQLEDAHVIMDLQGATIADKDAEIQSLKGQLALLRQDRRYEVG